MLPINICYTTNDGSIDYNNQELFKMDLKPPAWVFLSSKPKALKSLCYCIPKIKFQIPKYRPTLKTLFSSHITQGSETGTIYSFALCKLYPYSQRSSAEPVYSSLKQDNVTTLPDCWED